MKWNIIVRKFIIFKVLKQTSWRDSTIGKTGVIRDGSEGKLGGKNSLLFLWDFNLEIWEVVVVVDTTGRVTAVSRRWPIKVGDWASQYGGCKLPCMHGCTISLSIRYTQIPGVLKFKSLILLSF